jgi:hypothetical protein
MTPSLAPSTAARSQPMRELLCHSAWRCGMRAGACGKGTGGADDTLFGGDAVRPAAGIPMAGVRAVVFADMPCIALGTSIPRGCH